MSGHDFNFEGGEFLSKMGATWFVSYSYYSKIDKSHKNWQKIETYASRTSVFNRTKQFHKFWLQQVLEMKDSRLNTNTIGLNAIKTKEIAKRLLLIEKTQ